MSQVRAQQATTPELASAIGPTEDLASTGDRARRTARRSLLALGGAAGAGLAALFTASPAEAKAGDPLRAGRTVDAGTAGTLLRTKSSKTAFGVLQNGSGYAVSVRNAGSGSGLRSVVAARAKAALVASQEATSTDPGGLGAAILAAGKRNVGVRATTSAGVTAVPAIVATGAAGRGIAMLATGYSLLDGDLLALRNLVGVFDANDKLAYAHASSGDHATHTRHGVATLSGAGEAVVALGARYLKAVTISTLAVQLTPIGASMRDLYYQPTSTGFVIKGGTAGQKVSWVAYADRIVLTLSAKGQSAPAAGLAADSAGPGDETVDAATGGSVSARVVPAPVVARRGTARPRPSGVRD